MNFKTVKGRQRNTFLVKHFGSPIFDNNVFRMADKMIDGYNGGYWEYVEGDFAICDDDLGAIPVNFAFLQPESDPTLPKVIFNPISGEQVTVCADLAGMIVTYFALLLMYEKTNNASLRSKLDNLYDAIQQRCSDIDRWDVWMTIMD